MIIKVISTYDTEDSNLYGFKIEKDGETINWNKLSENEKKQIVDMLSSGSKFFGKYIKKEV